MAQGKFDHKPFGHAVVQIESHFLQDLLDCRDSVEDAMTADAFMVASFDGGGVDKRMPVTVPKQSTRGSQAAAGHTYQAS